MFFWGVNDRFLFSMFFFSPFIVCFLQMVFFLLPAQPRSRLLPSCLEEYAHQLPTEIWLQRPSFHHAKLLQESPCHRKGVVSSSSVINWKSFTLPTLELLRESQLPFNGFRAQKVHSIFCLEIWGSLTDTREACLEACKVRHEIGVWV